MSKSIFKNIFAAISDIRQGVFLWRIWALLAYNDIGTRYRRSKIGPFWITLSMGVTILMMGFLYSKLFNMPTQDYFPFLAAGLITWGFISISITESTTAFMGDSQLFKQIKLPYSLAIFRLCMKNIIILIHNLVIMLPIFYFFDIKLSWNMLLIFPGLVICSIFVFIYTYICAIISTRYRDMGPIITSLVQIAFFVTPIIWEAKILPESYRFLNAYNPVLPFVDLIRIPILGQTPGSETIIAASVVLGLGFMLLIALLQRTYKKIIYWL